MRASTLEWTILRHQIYADLLSARRRERARSRRQLHSSVGARGDELRRRAKIARASTRRRSRSGWSGRRILDVTGPSP